MGELRQRGPFKGQICVSGPHIGGGGSPFNGPLRRFFIETESFTFRSPRLKPLKNYRIGLPPLGNSNLMGGCGESCVPPS